MSASQMFSRFCTGTKALMGNALLAAVRNSTSTCTAGSKKILYHQHRHDDVTVPQRMMSSERVDLSDYPSDVEISYDEFKFVESILPKSTVPEIPHHASYPTPSGWIPPNDELRNQQPYLIRRTKNHVLPVYAAQKETWGRIMHHIVIKRIEGDIWKLEADLRHFLIEKYNLTNLYTQVHEVSRCVRVRGQYHEDIAQFLLDRGM